MHDFQEQCQVHGQQCQVENKLWSLRWCVCRYFLQNIGPILWTFSRYSSCFMWKVEMGRTSGRRAARFFSSSGRLIFWTTSSIFSRRCPPNKECRFLSRVEGKMSRVEGRMSRGEGNMLRIEDSKMSSIYLLSFNIIVLYPLALNFPPFTH